VENAYRLSQDDSAVRNLILFDVFHHLAHPGTALDECHRVLASGGRLILFEPCVSLLGRLVYGPMHPEPLGLKEHIQWRAPENFNPDAMKYYAAQGNAWRLFVRGEISPDLAGWKIRTVRRLAAISYVASGGYSGPQLFPARALGLMRLVDRICDHLPAIFATRLLVVLEKTPATPAGSK
jgi:SAM-dependent methyltransferase